MKEGPRPVPGYQIESQTGSRLLEIDRAFEEERSLINAMDQMIRTAEDKEAAKALALREWIPRIEVVRRRRAALLERYLDEIGEE